MITKTCFTAALALGMFWMEAASAQTSPPPARAQAPSAVAAPADDPAKLVDEVVVAGRASGPAWWSVADADTVVHVMGAPAFFPKGQRFETAQLSRRLDGATVLIVGQTAHMTVGSFMRTVIGSKKKFRSGRPLRDTLPPDLRTRLEAHLLAEKAPLDLVDGDKAAFAGFRLAYDASSEGSIDIGEPTGRIRAVAKSRTLAKPPPIRKLSDFNLIDAARSLAAAPQPVQELCLAAGLRQAETGEDGIRATARRWARGEVRDVLPVGGSFAECLAADPLITRNLARGRDEATAAIVEALETPGKAVAVIELRTLLEDNGVLDQLRARGFVVQAPDELAAEATTTPPPVSP